MRASGISQRAGPRFAGSGGGTIDGFGVIGGGAGRGALLDKDDMFTLAGHRAPNDTG
jgi:hypothetical protein